MTTNAEQPIVAIVACVDKTKFYIVYRVTVSWTSSTVKHYQQSNTTNTLSVYPGLASYRIKSFTLVQQRQTQIYEFIVIVEWFLASKFKSDFDLKCIKYN